MGTTAPGLTHGFGEVAEFNPWHGSSRRAFSEILHQVLVTNTSRPLRFKDDDSLTVPRDFSCHPS